MQFRSRLALERRIEAITFTVREEMMNWRNININVSAYNHRIRQGLNRTRSNNDDGAMLKKKEGKQKGDGKGDALTRNRARALRENAK